MSQSMRLLGLDQRNINKNQKEESIKQLTKGLRILIQYHLGRFDENEAADALAEILFGHELFNDQARTEAAVKVTRSVTNSIFTAYTILRSIDMHAGALNDIGVNQLSEVERDTGLYKIKRGKGMIVKRWKISQARKIANEFVQQMLLVEHTPESEFGDMIAADTNRLFRYAVEAFGLKGYAVNDDHGIEIAITGDGAAITTSSSTAGQCVLGFKMIDVKSKDPKTGEPIYYEDSDDGRRVYKNSQSIDTCLPLCMVEGKESDDLIKKGFKSYFDWCLNANVCGIAAKGNEPAFRPLRCVCNGDYSFLRKVTACGGGCKIARKFCIYCEVDGTDNMFHSVSGD